MDLRYSYCTGGKFHWRKIALEEFQKKLEISECCRLCSKFEIESRQFSDFKKRCLERFRRDEKINHQAWKGMDLVKNSKDRIVFLLHIPVKSSED